MTTRTVQIEVWKARLARALGKKSLLKESCAARPQTRRSTPKNDERAGTMGAVEASRAAVAIIAYDCTSFVDAAARQTERVLHKALQKSSIMTIGLSSSVAVGSTDVALAASSAARSVKGLEVVGALGGVGLMAASTLNMWRAETSEEALDATADLAWGAQGFSYVTGATRAAAFTTGLGFVGAAVRMSAGVVRIRRGLRSRNLQTVKLGTLDLGVGMLWGALDVAGLGHPVVLGSYVVMMVGREAYANREALRKWWLFPKRFFPCATESYDR
jgi:hypothetical protein